jgi:predicted phage terminase large subunit-like protein
VKKTRTPRPEEIAGLAAQDLGCYGALLHPKFEIPPHVQLLVSELEAVERTPGDRLIVELPPRHSKSFSCSELFPAWFLGRNPSLSVVGSTYAQELADMFGRRVRNLIFDPKHSAVFPGCRISEESAAAARFDLSAGGSYFGIGRGGGLTGRGADLLIVDDPLKDLQEAQSPAVRASLKDWFSGVAFTRLEPGGRIVVVSTRWHEDDLAGWLLREHAEEGWRELRLPAIAERDEGWRREGEALWPERRDLTALARIREQLGTGLWSALYQQHPIPLEGSIFKPEWFGAYPESPDVVRSVVPGFQRVIQAWDSAYKTASGNDYSVGITIAECKTGFRILHVLRGRWEFPDLCRKMIELAAAWKPSAVIVEDAASGQSVTQVLKTETKLPVIGHPAKGGKVLRAQLVAPLCESGRVLLPDSAPWKSSFLEELASFPGAAHDDQVDALVHGLTYLRENARGEFRFAIGDDRLGRSAYQWQRYGF